MSAIAMQHTAMEEDAECAMEKKETKDDRIDKGCHRKSQ